MKKLRILLFLITLSINSFAQEQITDIASTSGDGSSNPENFVMLGKHKLFQAFNIQYGKEWWIIKEGSKKAELLKDIVKGSYSSLVITSKISSSDDKTTFFVVGNNLLYFMVEDPIAGIQIWVTDGNVTELLNIDTEGPIRNFGYLNGQVIVFVEKKIGSLDIVAFDEKTYSKKNIKTDIEIQSGSDSPRTITQNNKFIFFGFQTKNSKIQLWRTDGTESGTNLQFEKARSNSSNRWFYQFYRPILIEDDLLLTIEELDQAFLYRFDKSFNSARKILSIGKRHNFNYFNDDTSFFTLNNINYFLHVSRFTSSTLWETDGTQSGTKLLKTWNFGPGGFSNIIESKGELYFLTPVNSKEIGLVKYTLANNQTEILQTFFPSFSNNQKESKLIKLNDDEIIFDAAKDNSYKLGLWKTNLITLKTELLSDINVRDVFQVNNTELLLSATEPNRENTELWQYDNTTKKVEKLEEIAKFPQNNLRSLKIEEKILVSTIFERPFIKDIIFDEADNKIKVLENKENISERPLPFVNQGKIYYFSNEDLFISDLDYSKKEKLLTVDYKSSQFKYFDTEFFSYKNMVFIFISVKEGLYEIWVTDGTKKGTVKFDPFGIEELSKKYSRFYPYFKPFLVNNKIIFFSRFQYQDGNNFKTEYSLWESDGNAKGTSQILKSEEDLFRPIIFKDKLYYFFNGSKSCKFLEVDVLAKKFKVVKEFSHTVNSQIIVSPKNIYFTSGYSEGDTGIGRIYKTDGTDNGTVLRKEFKAKSEFKPFPSYVGRVNDKLVFYVGNESTGLEPWVYDEKTEETKLLKDINEGIEGSRPTGWFVNSVNLETKLLFNAYLPSKGNELWVTDGTSENTKLLKDIFVGKGSSLPQNMTVLNNKVYFSAYSQEHGNEVWSTDGTTENTILQSDVLKGETSSNPRNFYIIKDFLIFSADSGEKGRQFWAVDLSKPASQVTDVLLNDDDIENATKVFPNPTSSNLNIHLNDEINDEANYSIYDTLGRNLLSKTLGGSKNSLNIEFLKSGLYFLVVDTNNKKEIFKVIKN
jgi:ELWxxDGT repeat protein